MRLTRDSDTDEVRDALVEHDMDDLTAEDIEEIAIACWGQFEPIIRSHLEKRWADRHDVWLEAEDRGYFEQGAD